jgi:hypothetical protein
MLDNIKAVIVLGFFLMLMNTLATTVLGMACLVVVSLELNDYEEQIRKGSISEIY